MNYKQRYKEAIERMKSLARSEHPEYFTEAQKLAEFTFPELKESEDERIREEIKQFLKKHNGWIKEWIDWLEKQGERKPTWSEEDALRLEEVICMIAANGRWVRSDDAVKLVLDWLKSLKGRFGCEANFTTTKERYDLTN